MECSILAANSNKINIIDMLPYKSIVWENRYNESGASQCVFSKTDDVLESVKIGNFIVLELGDSIHYIHSVQVTDTEVWAYGYEVKELLNKAVVEYNMPSGTPSTSSVMLLLIRSVHLPWMAFSSNYSAFDNTLPDVSTFRWATVFEDLQDVCRVNDGGFVSVYDTVLKKASIRFVKGADKSHEVRFAKNFGNASDLKYTITNKSYINKVYAVGTDNIFETDDDGTTASGTYAAVLDLRDTFPRDDDVSEADYRAALASRAHMSLIARHVTEKIEIGDIDTSDYGNTYGLGDIVSVEIPELGVVVNRRVLAESYTVEGNRVKLKLTLGGV